MLLTRRSLWSGITRVRDLPITPEQYAAWESGMVIQRAMAHLSIEDREWVITGMTAEEWQEMCRTEKDGIV